MGREGENNRNHLIEVDSVRTGACVFRDTLGSHGTITVPKLLPRQEQLENRNSGQEISAAIRISPSSTSMPNTIKTLHSSVK
jgi:hypothetical protein